MTRTSGNRVKGVRARIVLQQTEQLGGPQTGFTVCVTVRPEVCGSDVVLL